MEQNLTLENLPKRVSQNTKILVNIERLLLEISKPPPTETPEQLITIDEVCELLHLTKPTIYSKHSKGELPGVCKRGKRLYFQKQVIIDWVKQGVQKSNSEIEAEAEAYLSDKKKGLKL